MTDGGSEPTGRTTRWADAVPDVPGSLSPDDPVLGTPDGQHLFAPAELPRWALALPALAALVAAAGAESSVHLAAGTFPAAVGSSAVVLTMVVVVALALRFA